MFLKTIIKQAEYIVQLEKNIKLTHRNNEDIQKAQIDDFIMTLNEIQDVEVMKIPEAEKNIHRNNIIVNKRTELLTKLIELSNTHQSLR